MSTIFQRVDYKIQRKGRYPKLDRESRGMGSMSKSEYPPEFIKEMETIIAGEHIGPFKNAHELDAYIRSLPDEDEDE